MQMWDCIGKKTNKCKRFIVGGGAYVNVCWIVDYFNDCCFADLGESKSNCRHGHGAFNRGAHRRIWYQ